MYSFTALLRSSICASDLVVFPNRPIDPLPRRVPRSLSFATSSLIAAITLARTSGDALSSSSLETPTLLKYAVS